MMLLFLVLGCQPGEVDELPTSGSLSVLTYNVHGLPDEITGEPRELTARMGMIAPTLDDYDLVGLQEDWTEAGHAALVAEATHPIAEWFDAEIEPARAYGSGLTVLSRAGTRGDYVEEHYTECNGTFDGASDCLASKGFQVLRLQLGAHEVDIYNTHHEAGGGEEDEAARRTQVTQVLASLSAYSEGRAVIFMGDTNLHPGDPVDDIELARYADAGLTDACDLASCAEADHIDRFLLRDGDGLTLNVTSWSRETHLVDGEGEDLSDHPALSIEVAWE